MKKCIYALTLVALLCNHVKSQSLPTGTTSIKPYLVTNKLTIGQNPSILNKLYIEDRPSSSYPVEERDFIKLVNTDTGAGSAVSEVMQSGTSGARFEIGQHGSTYGYGIYGGDVYANRGTVMVRGGSGLILRSSPPSSDYNIPYDGITFRTGSVSDPERMRITGDGNVGIGTTAPHSKLQVTNGDVYVDNPNSGIILKSPNGYCWRVTIDNNGNFVRTQISCP